MNICDFNASLHAIKKGIEYTFLELEYERKFSDKTRIDFNVALDQLMITLNKDKSHLTGLGEPWHTARRIVDFNDIQSRLEQIRDRIFKISDIPYFVKKIKDIQPLLKERIKELKKGIGQKGRLPFSIGPSRDNFYSEVQSNLHLKNLKKVSTVQKEFFHLMANYFDKDIETNIDIATLSGSEEIYSFESWKSIIQEFLERSTMQVDKEIGLKILHSLEKAIPLSLKENYLVSLLKKNFQNDYFEIEYYKDLIQLNQDHVLTEESFSNKYILDAFLKVPLNVAINEIIWDIHDTIHRLNPGESHPLTFGTKTHCIVVEITCHEKANDTSAGNYTFTIINTGGGVRSHHQLDLSRDYAYPLSYVNIPESAFSYSFFWKLKDISFNSSKIDEFYQFNDMYFTDDVKAGKMIDQNPIYQLQKFGTCTYSSIEAWIESKMSLDQKELLRNIKVEVSLSKHSQLIQTLTDQSKESVEWKVVERKRKRENEGYIDKSKFLKISQFLYDLGKTILLNPEHLKY